MINRWKDIDKPNLIVSLVILSNITEEKNQEDRLQTKNTYASACWLETNKISKATPTFSEYSDTVRRDCLRVENPRL